MDEVRKIVYLMRGLPGCGKSFRAKQLAGETGTVLETDEYFYTQVGEDASSYDYDDKLLPAAREWVFQRFCDAIESGTSPIVLDRGNGRNPETQVFARHAVKLGYEVELAEPVSSWWQELRTLLKYKRYVADELFDELADELSHRTRNEHRVPAKVIRRWMKHWKADLTVEDILDLDPTA